MYENHQSVSCATVGVSKLFKNFSFRTQIIQIKEAELETIG